MRETARLSPVRLRRRSRRRGGVLAFGALLVAGVFGTSVPSAWADAPILYATGTVDTAVLANTTGGLFDPIVGGHVTFARGGTTVLGYTLSPVPIDWNITSYTGAPWSGSGYPASGLAQAAWIIEHQDGAPPAAVQAAVWHVAYPGQFDLSLWRNDPTIVAAYQTLIAAPGSATEPVVSPDIRLGLVPEGQAGQRQGPFAVRSNVGDLTLSLEPGAPAGVSIVDAAGAPLTVVPDGGQFWLEVPAGLPAGSVDVDGSVAPDMSGLYLKPGDNIAAMVDGVMPLLTSTYASWSAGAPTPSPTATPTSSVRPTTAAAPTPTSPTPTPTHTNGGGTTGTGPHGGDPVSGDGSVLARTGGDSRTVAGVLCAGLAGIVAGALLLLLGGRRRGWH